MKHNPATALGSYIQGSRWPLWGRLLPDRFSSANGEKRTVRFEAQQRRSSKSEIGWEADWQVFRPAPVVEQNNARSSFQHHSSGRRANGRQIKPNGADKD